MKALKYILYTLGVVLAVIFSLIFLYFTATGGVLALTAGIPMIIWVIVYGLVLLVNLFVSLQAKRKNIVSGKIYALTVYHLIMLMLLFFVNLNGATLWGTIMLGVIAPIMLFITIPTLGLFWYKIYKEPASLDSYHSMKKYDSQN